MPNTPPAYVNPAWGTYELGELRWGYRLASARHKNARSRVKKMEKWAREEESVQIRRIVVKMNHP